MGHLDYNERSYSLTAAAALALAGNYALTGLSIGSSIEGARQLHERIMRRRHRIKVLKERIEYYDKRLKNPNLSPHSRRQLLNHRAEDKRSLDKKFSFIAVGAAIAGGANIVGTLLIRKLAKLMREEKIDKSDLDKIVNKKRLLVKYLMRNESPNNIVKEAIIELQELQEIRDSLNR